MKTQGRTENTEKETNKKRGEEEKKKTNGDNKKQINYREINLIQYNHPPYRYIKRERKCTKQSIGLFFNEWKCDYK